MKEIVKFDRREEFETILKPLLEKVIEEARKLNMPFFLSVKTRDSNTSEDFSSILGGCNEDIPEKFQLLYRIMESEMVQAPIDMFDGIAPHDIRQIILRQMGVEDDGKDDEFTNNL